MPGWWESSPMGYTQRWIIHRYMCDDHPIYVPQLVSSTYQHVHICLCIYFGFIYILYSVLHHPEANNRCTPHRGTSIGYRERDKKNETTKTWTPDIYVCTFKLCYIFYADVFAFGLTTVTTWKCGSLSYIFTHPPEVLEKKKVLLHIPQVLSFQDLETMHLIMAITR